MIQANETHLLAKDTVLQQWHDALSPLMFRMSLGSMFYVVKRSEHWFQYCVNIDFSIVWLLVLQINIWSYNNRELLHDIDTGHSANIFCTKFVPETCDEVVVSGAGDAEVHLSFSFPKNRFLFLLFWVLLQKSYWFFSRFVFSICLV
jgi:hypothetical protein